MGCYEEGRFLGRGFMFLFVCICVRGFGSGFRSLVAGGRGSEEWGRLGLLGLLSFRFWFVFLWGEGIVRGCRGRYRGGRFFRFYSFLVFAGS